MRDAIGDHPPRGAEWGILRNGLPAAPCREAQEAGGSDWNRRHRPDRTRAAGGRFGRPANHPLSNGNRRDAMTKRFAFAAGLALALMSATASGADKLKVGFIYVGPIGDHGWTYQHDVGPARHRGGVRGPGRDGIRREHRGGAGRGAGHHPPRPGRRRPHLHHPRSGHGPDHQGGRALPGREVRACTATKRADNVSTYSARFYEGRYVSRPDRGPGVEERGRGLHRLVPESRRWSAASTRSCWAHSPSTRTSR